MRKEGREILRLDEFVLEEGRICALLGPNGAGKSTLVRILAGLEKPGEGVVRFLGEEVGPGRRSTAIRRRCSVVFQSPLLFDASVSENVAAGLRFRGVDRTETAERVGAALSALGIASLARRRAGSLSGGEASRVSLARALVLNPEVLFLDEPFQSLDFPTRERLIGDLAALLRARRTTVMFVTHEALEALRMADRMVLLFEGRITQSGPCDAVVRAPHDERAARFLGVENFLRGRVVAALEDGHLVEADGSRIEAAGEVPVGQDVLLCLRAEDIILSDHPVDRAGLSARNVFAGKVREIIPTGHGCKVHLDCGFPLTASLTRHSVESLGLSPGREVQALFKATAVHTIRL